MQRVVVLCLSLGLATPVVAQNPPPTSPRPAAPTATRPATGPIKVAFIRSQEILQAMPAWVAAESTLAHEVQGYRDEIQKLQQQLDSAVQAFDQQSIALSPAAKTAKQRDLQTLQQRYQQRGGELEQRVQQRQQELLAPINTRIRAIIEGIRAEDNIAFIFDADAQGGVLVSADPSLNITAKVIQRLQQS
jgi:outer membrane protein